MVGYSALQAQLGFTFQNEALLRQALTHRSYVEENRFEDGGLTQHQQRLEFLGDAFLNYVGAMEMYLTFPNAPEGELTEQRMKRVRGEWLQQVGQRLGLGSLLRRGRGEAMNANNKKVIEDTMEALIGAVLLDQGAAEAGRLVKRLIMEPFHEDALSGAGAGASSGLGGLAPGQATTLFMQRWQALVRDPTVKAPQPSFIRIGGEDHLPLWQGTLDLPAGGFFAVQGTNKKQIKDELYAQALPHLY